MKRKIKNILLFLVPLLLLRCANVVAPTGGPKDTTPPKVKEALPANGNTDFVGKKIELTFDEYVTLTNAKQEVLFSPPIAEKPDVKLSGKTVVVKFKEALNSNTTYTIHFGDAIKDLHEGNVFKDYIYTFSTGNCLDTLSLEGKVVNADDEKAADGLFVALYDEDSDSLLFQPLRRAPDFIAKTQKDGSFHFHGLPDKCFLVFALNDVNSNLYYDMPNEKVAFIDTLVSPTDSVQLTLYAFTEIDTTQRLLENKLVEEGLLRFVFRHPADGVDIVTYDPLPDTFMTAQVWSKERDTLCWYFTPHVRDSLRVEVQSDDTLINNKFNFSLKYKDTKSGKGRKPLGLKVSNNLKGNLLMPGEELLLRFVEPIVDVRLSDTLYFEQTDTLGMEFCLAIADDDTTQVAVKVPDSVFFSLRGRTNTAFDIKYKKASDADLSNIIIKVCPPENTPAVVQLLNSRGAVVDERFVDSTATVEFRQLIPGKYKLQAIIDTDRNGKRSTGNFHKGFLPETVVPYKDEFDLKAGWDVAPDEIWIFIP